MEGLIPSHTPFMVPAKNLYHTGQMLTVVAGAHDASCGHPYPVHISILDCFSTVPAEVIKCVNNYRLLEELKCLNKNTHVSKLCSLNAFYQIM